MATLDYGKKLTQYAPIIARIGNGGKFYAFSSAAEDLSLTMDELGSKKFRFSKFAAVRIPPILNRPDENTLKLNAISGAYRYIRGNNSEDQNKLFAESFQNYCLNLETGILSHPEYNVLNEKNVSERVFWKWIKEMGGIRFQNSDIEGCFHEEDNEEGVYNRVVKYVGDVNYAGVQMNSYNNYVEVICNIPEFTASNPYVLFKTNPDQNYIGGINSIRKVATAGDTDTEYIFGRNQLTNSPDGLDLRAWYDNDDGFSRFPTSQAEYVAGVSGFYAFRKRDKFKINTNEIFFDINNDTILVEQDPNNPNAKWDGLWALNDYWFGNTNLLSELDKNIYKFDTDRYNQATTEELGLFYGQISELLQPGSDFRFTTANILRYKRTTLDAIEINWDINDYRQFYERDGERFDRPLNRVSQMTWNDLANVEKSENYEFNAILLYYDIYETKEEKVGNKIIHVINNDTITTNLFGVLFLDDVEPYSDNGGFIRPFHKKRTQDRVDGEIGNEFGFRLMFKFDVNARIKDVVHIPMISENNSLAVGRMSEVLEKMVESTDVFAQSQYKMNEIIRIAQELHRLAIKNVDTQQVIERLERIEEWLPANQSNSLFQQLAELLEINFSNQRDINQIKSIIEQQQAQIQYIMEHCCGGLGVDSNNPPPSSPSLDWNNTIDIFGNVN